MTYALIMNDTFGSYLASLVVMPICYFIYYISGHKININKLIPAIIFSAVSLLSVFNLLPNANSLGGNLNQFGTDVNKVVTQSEDMEMAGTTRMRLWLDTIERIKERPIIGFGPMGFNGANAITNYDSPHNEFLQITGFLGFPGLFIYLGSLITLCINKFKKIKEVPISILCTGTVLIVYLASSCFGNPVFNTYPYYWLFFGLTSGSPLFDLSSEEIIDELNSKTNIKHLIKVVISTLLFSLVIYLISYYYLDNLVENAREQADISIYNAAVETTKLQIQSNNVEFNEKYYLDIENYTLTKEKPVAYGQGTEKRGHILSDNSQYKNIEYDESIDYTNKVIQIVAYSEDNIVLSWVD